MYFSLLIKVAREELTELIKVNGNVKYFDRDKPYLDYSTQTQQQPFRRKTKCANPQPFPDIYCVGEKKSDDPLLQKGDSSESTRKRSRNQSHETDSRKTQTFHQEDTQKHSAGKRVLEQVNALPSQELDYISLSHATKPPSPSSDVIEVERPTPPPTQKRKSLRDVFIQKRMQTMKKMESSSIQQPALNANTILEKCHSDAVVAEHPDTSMIEYAATPFPEERLVNFLTT